jgi:short-subunit dehydrogenase
MALRRLALITGGSAGIGAAFAKVYARQGFDVALVARRRERLDELGVELRKAHGIDTISIVADLAQPGAVDTILAQLMGPGRNVDVLVNNAGYGLPGTWAGTSWQDQAAALQVMLTAPLELTHKVLPAMIAERWGRVLNIASLAGFAPGARGHTTYGAIKAALIKFSQSVNVELEGTGVHCTAVCPGFTFSEFHDVNGTRERVNQLPKWMWSTAEDVAESGWQASERNRPVVVPGAPNKVLAGLAKAIPDDLALHMVKGLRGPDYDPKHRGETNKREGKF